VSGREALVALTIAERVREAAMAERLREAEMQGRVGEAARADAALADD
jgi:uncharacterized protein YdbL (DUF1318 family)